MLARILSTAAVELAIARRNRWVAIAVTIMALFALVLAAASAAPSGNTSTDRLSVTVASFTSLAVYLVPLIALLIAFDSVSGEIERGTLPLHLSYPVARGELLAGKFLAQLAVIAVAVTFGYGVAALAVLWSAGAQALEGLPAFVRLIWTSILLGAVFLSLGHLLSCLARRSSGAAGLAIGLWLALVVLYDLGLLAAVVADDGGAFTRRFFPWFLVLNPADAFRIFNLAASDAVGAASGLAGAASSIGLWKPLASLLLWPMVAASLALLAFRRVEP